MSQGRMKKKDLPALPLVLLTGCLVLGAAAGCIWLAFFQKDAVQTARLEQWAQAGRLLLFFRLLGSCLVYLLPLFCCGLVPLGAYGVLLLFGARGFTLACWVGEFCRAYGLGGYAASLVLGAAGALLTTLCMLEMGEGAIRQALRRKPGRRRGRRRRGMAPRRHLPAEYCRTGVLCLLLSGVYSLLGSLLAPYLCQAALAWMG